MSIINKLKAVADIIAPPVGYKTLFIRSDTGVPALMDSDGNVENLVLGGDAAGVTYTPDNALYWTDSVDPGNVAEALDDLAVRLNVVENDSAIPPDAAEVTYEPQTPLHWTDSEDPGNVDAALDDLAARVNSLEENPGGGGVTDAADLTYTPSTLGNWDSGADPGDAADAFDQLASRTKTLETAVVDASAVTFTPAHPIHWTDSEDPGDVDDALNDLASRLSGIEEQQVADTLDFMSGFIASPSAKDYRIVVKAGHGGTITETTTICVSGTCTATFKINTTALGGTANSVSSAEQSQAHTTNNVFATGDDIVITISSVSSPADMSFTIKYLRAR